jgi:murein DD-endopeptidase MepM/ murein hydrolase activator NlpD
MMEKNRFAGRWILIFVAGTALIAALVLGFARVGPPPDINIRPAAQVIGKRTQITIEIRESKRGLSRVTVEFMQGSRIEKLAEKDYPFPSWWNFWGARTVQDSITVTVGRETIQNLQPGQAGIRVTAGRTSTWLSHPAPASQEILLPVRLKPPSLQLVSSQTYVSQGGSEAVVYRVGETSVRDGVRAGKWWFPGYPLAGGGKGEHFAFFAVPFDMNAPDVRIVAVDEAENEAELAFIDRFTPKKFKQDAVDLSDQFLGKVVPEIMSQTPEFRDRGGVLDNYLAINRELRRKNAEVLVTLAAKSPGAFLWNRPFLFMRNGKVMAGFADARTYVYQGKTVDHQTHLGYDLAVTRHAPVPAGNDGVVALAGYFGIYGNTVIIDHGYGIMSLYGHLSSLGVSAGQKVARGDTIGNTGETGLAGGDHLHFAIILAGLPVNPVEWWDAHWIGDRLARKLGAAFPFTDAPAAKK